ncbi:hypothetical protein K7432_017041, partial [Basidiobolus ranarum]
FYLIIDEVLCKVLVKSLRNRVNILQHIVKNNMRCSFNKEQLHWLLGLLDGVLTQVLGISIRFSNQQDRMKCNQIDEVDS